MKKGQVHYSVWVPEVKDDNGDVIDGGYYKNHDTLEEAVQDNEEGDAGVEVFAMTPRRLGVFVSKVEVVRVQQTKKRKKVKRGS